MNLGGKKKKKNKTVSDGNQRVACLGKEDQLNAIWICSYHY